MIAALRALVTVLAVAGVLLGAFALSAAARAPRAGFSYDATRDGWLKIVSVVPNSPASGAGLHAGDVVRFASPADRDIVTTSHVAGRAVRLRRTDGSVVTLVPGPIPLGLGHAVELAQGIFFSLLALLIVVRAWRDVQARRLALGFLWTVYFFAANMIEQPPWLAQAAMVVFDVIAPGGMLALVFFATGWQATPPALARWLRRAATIVAAAYLIVNLLDDAVLVPGPALRRIFEVSESAGWALLAAFVIAGLLGSAGKARGVERQRVGWILATFTVVLAPWIVYEPLLSLGLAASPPWLAFTTILLPFGLAYATLRHRVIDLGFALNRAAVFAATTALLVGLFGALQWGADQVLVAATRTAGFAVQMAIAVIVLYAVRLLRVQTDTFVARVFFAKRRRRIDAIARLGRDVDAVASVEALPAFVVDGLQRDAAIPAAFYVEGEDGYARVGGNFGPGLLARDEPAIVRLRAAPAVLQIGPLDGTGPATAFPLTIRGRLRGVIVCAPSEAGEEFAPDEQQALGRLADRIAVARDDLLAEELRRENGALRREAATAAGRLVVLERENTLLERLAGHGVDHDAAATARVAAE